MKKMNIKALYVCTVILIFSLISISGINSNAGTTTFLSTGKLKKGDTIIFDSSDLTKLDNRLSTMDNELTALENSVGNSKEDILNVIRHQNPNINVASNASFADITSYIARISSVPENTYFYEQGTEGNSSTIRRFKKINNKYYICDAYGGVATGTSETNVTSLTLVPYAAATPKNFSAGSAGYSSGHFYLGDGSDNTTYYNQGKINGNCIISIDLNGGPAYTSHSDISASSSASGIIRLYLNAETGTISVLENTVKTSVNLRASIGSSSETNKNANASVSALVTIDYPNTD